MVGKDQMILRQRFENLHEVDEIYRKMVGNLRLIFIRSYMSS